MTITLICIASVVYLFIGMSDSTQLFDKFVYQSYKKTKQPMYNNLLTEFWGRNPWIRYRTLLGLKYEDLTSTDYNTYKSFALTVARVLFWPIDLLLFFIAMAF